MPTLVIVALLVVGVAVLAVGGLWWSRTHTLARRVGSFGCLLQQAAGGPTSRGVAQYGTSRLYWWRHWSLAPRPAVRWERSGLTVLDRAPHPADEHWFVVRCRAAAADTGSRRDTVEFTLEMSREAYAGLTSWIEATPSRVDSVI